MARGPLCPVLPPLMLLLLLLPLPLLRWAAASPVLSAGTGSEADYSVCNTRCCTVEPNCSAALHVTCRCDTEPRVILRRGDFPASVESIEIYGVRQLTIYENAVLDLTSLTKVELWRVDSLTVHPNGLALQRNSSLFTFVIDNVKKLTIASSAFSGFWERGTRIKIWYVSKLHIQPHAFSFQSMSHNPGLIIEKVTVLDMASKALNGSFNYVILKAVSTKLCRRNTFGENIHRIEMMGVQIREMRESCIRGTGNLHWLSMSNSNLGIIRHRGIHGNICNMQIHNSTVAKLQPNGFQFQVNNLRITRSKFTNIMTRGVNVLANNSVYLSKVIVGSLHRHALIAMRAPEHQPEKHTSVNIDDLTVIHAENGALTFNKSIDLELRRLSVRAPEHPVCPASEWVRQLTATVELEPLGEHILTMLQRDWLCQENSAEPNVGESGSLTAEEVTAIVVTVVFFLLVIAVALLLRTFKLSGGNKHGVKRKGKSSDGERFLGTYVMPQKERFGPASDGPRRRRGGKSSPMKRDLRGTAGRMDGRTTSLLGPSGLLSLVAVAVAVVCAFSFFSVYFEMQQFLPFNMNYFVGVTRLIRGALT